MLGPVGILLRTARHFQLQLSAEHVFVVERVRPGHLAVVRATSPPE